jgi:hypothetical protein
MTMRPHALVPALLLLVFLGGCGKQPKLVSVTGKVVHKGQPLTAGSVFFHPIKAPSEPERAKEISSSLLQLDGTFSAKTFPYGDGLPPGSYKVTLSPDLTSRVQMPVYGDPARTPWQLEVPAEGVRDHLFEVK